jgi:hypothetical protein
MVFIKTIFTNVKIINFQRWFSTTIYQNCTKNLCITKGKGIIMKKEQEEK